MQAPTKAFRIFLGRPVFATGSWGYSLLFLSYGIFHVDDEERKKSMVLKFQGYSGMDHTLDGECEVAPF